MLNKFHLRYTAVVQESRDRQYPSNQDLEVAWRLSHSLLIMAGKFQNIINTVEYLIDCAHL